MTDMKQVKVDNWGIYFLQRLKHFFNRTDYCDLTLQFQDNAQLKVHRLVLNACTEYFELLERTCEMYEDCLIMPEDLQADVVVPIVNFMYTGQLEFKIELLERLLQTSQIMNMPVLSKLLDAQRSQVISKPKVPPPTQSRQSYGRSSSTTNKRPYSKAFESVKPTEKKVILPPKKSLPPIQTLDVVKTSEKSNPVNNSQTIALVPRKLPKKYVVTDPRPTRYEVPEELDPDNIYDDSFHNISYETKPLMVHPETSKWYKVKKPEYGIFSEATGSRKFITENSSLDLVECRKITSINDSLFEDSVSEIDTESNIFNSNAVITQPALTKDANVLFDQAFESSSGPKVTIEAEDPKQAAKVDHAKIISEVLKKYPHLVNSNKNIKLKILENPSKQERKTSKKRIESQFFEKDIKVKLEPETENTYEDVLNSKEAAKLIAMGADNIKGPWICLICGTPGKALHFPQYYKFRRHLVEVHHEKPIPNICEYCGLKSSKRNYLLHHMYTKHGLPPPPNYNFPKCNLCNYVALTEGFLVKHKATHVEHRDFRCNVCFAGFKSSSLLLHHIQTTGHKYCADRKPNLQCVYCLKVFLRENNLYAHLKTNHRLEAKRDGIVDNSDEEEQQQLQSVVVQSLPIKFEPQAQTSYTEEHSNQVYKIQSDGNVQVTTHSPTKQKILNAGIDAAKQAKKRVRTLNPHTHEEFMDSEMCMISSNNSLNEAIMINEQNENTQTTEEFYLPASIEQSEEEHILPTSLSSQETEIVQNTLNKPDMNQSIEIVMSNEQQQLVTPSHPVIFDAHGNPSKALAVLTTLEAANTNDMMIIPDDYSIHVSEALNTKNSNIVVVYSHPVSDQNKQSFLVDPQYAQSQIISSQDVGTHFVSSSAVITPNFATIDTSAPIMSGQVVVSHTVQSFEGHIQNADINEQVTSQHQQLPTLTNEDEEADIITINPLHSDTLNEIQIMQQEHPEIQETHMLTDSTQLTEVEQSVELAMIPEESVIENTQIIVETEEGDTSMTDIVVNQTEQETVSDVIPQGVMTICDTVNIQYESPCEIDNIKAPCQTGGINQESLLNEEPILNEQLPPTNLAESQPKITEAVILTESEAEITENAPHPEAETSEVIGETENMEREAPHDEVPESPTFTQHEPHILDDNETIVAENIPEHKNVQAEVPITDIEVPVQSKEQIECLASEWSEDDEDTPACTQNDKIESASEQVNEETADSTEIEESIENIQQELTNQMAQSTNAQVTAEVVAEEPAGQNISLVETLTASEDSANGNTVAPQEKISSLLNDWEENDSREETNDEVGNVEQPQVEINNDSNKDCNLIELNASNNIETEGKVIENNGSGETEIALQNIAEPKKVANIKSLVSDWDDEDE